MFYGMTVRAQNLTLGYLAFDVGNGIATTKHAGNVNFLLRTVAVMKLKGTVVTEAASPATMGLLVFIHPRAKETLTLYLTILANLRLHP